MSVRPAACSVAAVDSMMKKAIRLENAMPMLVSNLMRRRCCLTSCGVCGSPAPAARSSTSWLACQKNR